METTLRLPKFLADDLTLLAQIKDELKTPYLSLEGVEILVRERENFERSIKRIDHDYLEAWR